MSHRLPIPTCCTLVLLLTTTAHANMSLGFQVSGQVDFEMVGFGQPGQSFANGNLTFTNVIPGSTVLFAAVYTNDFAPFGGGQSNISITDPFATPILTANNVNPTSQDPPTTPSNFGWEVPLAPVLVPGNGTYGISFNPSQLLPNPSTSQMHGAGMIIVFSDPSLPQQTITVMHGAEYLDGQTPASPHASQSVSFPESGASTIGAGSGTRTILPLGDDANDPPPNANETLDFNGNTIHSILDGNLDPISNTSSIVSAPVTTVAGHNNNIATVNAGSDIFGWHVAVLESPIPEPASLAMLTLTAPLLTRRKPQR